MNKVLITGLGTANELGMCETCSLNFSWLIDKPSTLLWADEICIPKSAYDIGKKQNVTKEDKVIGLFLDLAEEHNLLKTVDLSQMYPQTIGEEINQKMLLNSQTLMETFPEHVKKGEPGVPAEILIEGEHYCGVWMSSVYFGLKIAEDIDANCLFSKREHAFLKYIYGLSANNLRGHGVNNAYNEVFSLYLPESIGIHNYAFTPEEQCLECKKYATCKDTYLGDTEIAIEKILQWRDYDEIHQAKLEIDKILKVKGEVGSEKDVKDIIKKFQERQEKINKNINKRFPQIQRWTKMTTVLATPITIASAITGNIPLTIGGAVATGIAQATESLLEIYKSKNNWVGFVNSMKNME